MPLPGNLARKGFGNPSRRFRQTPSPPHPEAQLPQLPRIRLRQSQVVAYARLSQALVPVAAEPRGLGACCRYGRNLSGFSGGQCQGAGFIQEWHAAWIAAPQPDPAEDHQGRDFRHSRESRVVEHACGLLGGVIPIPLLKAGTGLPGFK